MEKGVKNPEQDTDRICVYRFYYSRQQKNVKQLVSFLKMPYSPYDNKKNFVCLNDGTTAEYTMCIADSEKSCGYKDGVLVATIKATERDILKRISRK